MVNQAILSGNLGQTPEIRNFETGTRKARFSIAVYKPVGKGKPPETNWITVECWNEIADMAMDNLKKGTSVIIVGSWQVETIEKDGKTSRFSKFVADEIGIKLKPRLENKGSFQQQTQQLETMDIPF